MTIGHEAGRLDRALVAALGVSGGISSPSRGGGIFLSRARVQQLIKEGHVTRGGKPVRDPNHKAREGEVYVLTLPPPEKAKPEAQAIPLDIIHEDADLLVINKPPGMVVHPAAGNRDKTLVNALLAHCGASLSGIGGVARPGIVHRLDKDTSGLMVVAKHDAAHQALTRQFADRSLSRVYQALVWGLPSPAAGQIEGAIGRHPRARQKMAVVARGGKAALTHYKVLENYGTVTSLVECRLETGRTHQIRVHMAHIRHPVVGDPVYGRRRSGTNVSGTTEKGIVARLQAFPRQALHAAELKFLHPCSGKPMRFKAPLPGDMAQLLKTLRRERL
ncbi:MAG: RluA family pseudouridine synthase [Alphaproteobacteria bacterium]|nr:RluA family pseudouridine synthase [Alphaproteobacteria bacterium]